MKTTTAKAKSLRPCVRCGSPFTPNRSTAKYCGVNCRTGAYHERGRLAKAKRRVMDATNARRRTINRLRRLWATAQRNCERAADNYSSAQYDGFDTHGQSLSPEFGKAAVDRAWRYVKSLRKYIRHEAAVAGIDFSLIIKEDEDA